VQFKFSGGISILKVREGLSSIPGLIPFFLFVEFLIFFELNVRRRAQARSPIPPRIPEFHPTFEILQGNHVVLVLFVFPLRVQRTFVTEERVPCFQLFPRFKTLFPQHPLLAVSLISVSCFSPKRT